MAGMRLTLGGLPAREVSVRTLRQRRIIQFRSLDEVTNKDELKKAILAFQVLAAPEIAEMLSLRKPYGGMQKTIVTLEADNTNMRLEVRKMKIEWQICRIHEKTSFAKCFRYMVSWEIVKDCKGAKDRFEVCRRCTMEVYISRRTPSTAMKRHATYCPRRSMKKKLIWCYGTNKAI
uniref:Uncharacterized protein n=1 Tax=Glossina pallidipes TaxID=7398 RepID=A0A1B0AHY7_GLOPL